MAVVRRECPRTGHSRITAERRQSEIIEIARKAELSHDQEMMNAHEVADFLGAHLETIRRLARRGRIPAFKVGKDWRFSRKAILDWINSQSLRRRAPNVLVVDDEEAFCNFVRRLAEPKGHVVHTASTGPEGLARVYDQRIDLILLDLKMEGMSGPGFLRELRKTHPDLPVIIVTGYPDGELMMEASQYGPLMLIGKPVNKELLLNSMNHALRIGFAEAAL